MKLQVYSRRRTTWKQLSWTHYRVIIKLKSEEIRDFYINESKKSRWNVRTLERAILSKIYEIILLAQKI